MEQSCWQKMTWSATSLAVQWLRIHLPMQATQAQSLVQEESTCYGATKSVQHVLSPRATMMETPTP